MSLGWLALATPVGAILAIAAVAMWRRPALGLGVLAVGLAVHNATIMVLLDAGAPGWAVRAFQLWKEALLVLLVVKLILEARERGFGGVRSIVLARTAPVRILDGLVVAFGLLLVLYFVASFVPSFGAETSLAQRLLSLRILGLIPALYLLGRVFGTRDAVGTRLSVNLVVVAAASVAVLGLVELWFVSTHFWITAGVREFTAWQGFEYRGPGGLPENFFQSTPDGLGLRRMVSTYISPLGIAYTALLVVPLIVGALLAVERPKGWPWIALALVLASMAFSLTRLALLCLVLEAVLWVVVARRPSILIAGIMALGIVGAAFGIYPRIGPLVTFSLVDVRPPAGAVVVDRVLGRPDPGGGSHDPGSPGPTGPDIVSGIVTQQDASIQAHIAAVRDGLAHAVEHPLGVGLGSTMPRFGTPTGPAESAFLGIVGEIGVLGGALFAALYGGIVLIGLAGALRWTERPFRELAILVGIGGIGLAPIVMTSAVWGDFSVTFLFWWAAGAVASRADAWSHAAEGSPAEAPASFPADPTP